jgi:uncharacterized protein YbjQ (UPF0145 family)
MQISTTPYIEGKTIVKQLGLVRGNTIRARHVGKDIMAGLKNIVEKYRRRRDQRLHQDDGRVPGTGDRPNGRRG